MSSTKKIVFIFHVIVTWQNIMALLKTICVHYMISCEHNKKIHYVLMIMKVRVQAEDNRQNHEMYWVEMVEIWIIWD